MRQQILDRGPLVRRAILQGLVVGTPVVFLRTGHDPFNVPKLALLLVGVSIVAAIRVAELIQGASSHSLKRLVFPAAALGGPLLASWVFAAYRGFSLFGLYPRFQGLVPYLLVILFAVLLADAFDRLEDLARSVLTSGTVVGAYAAVQFAGLDPFRWDLSAAVNPVISTIGNANFVGGFLGIVMPIGLVLVLLEEGDRRRRTIQLFVPVVAGWLLAQSQGGWLAGVAGIGIVGGVYLSSRWRFADRAGLAIAALCALGAVGVVAAATMFPDSRLAFSSALIRGRWWIAAGRMALSSPLFGSGPNSFAVEGIHHRTVADAVSFNFDFPDDPHSVFFSVLSGAGLLGGIGFFALVAWTIRKGLSLKGDDHLLGVAFFAGAVAYFVQSLVSIDEPTLRAAGWIAIAGIAVATSGNARSDISRPKDKKGRQGVSRSRGGTPRRSRGSPAERVKAWPAVITCVVIGLAGTVYGVGFLWADHNFGQAMGSFQAGEPLIAKDQIEKALSFRPDVLYQASLAAELKDAALEGDGTDRALFESANEAFSYLRSTPLVFGLVNHAQLLDLWGEDRGDDQDQAAIGLYDQAIEIDALNPLIRAESARVHIEIGDNQGAVDVLDDAVPYVGRDSKYAEFWGLLALAHARLGDEGPAIEAISVALAANPGEVNALRAQEILDRS